MYEFDGPCSTGNLITYPTGGCVTAPKMAKFKASELDKLNKVYWKLYDKNRVLQKKIEIQNLKHAIKTNASFLKPIKKKVNKIIDNIKEGSMGSKKLERKYDAMAKKSKKIGYSDSKLFSNILNTSYKKGFKRGEGGIRASKNLLKNRTQEKGIAYRKRLVSSGGARETLKIFNSRGGSPGEFSKGLNTGTKVTKKLKEGTIGLRKLLKKKGNKILKSRPILSKGATSGAENKVLKQIHMRNYTLQKKTFNRRKADKTNEH